MRFMMLMKADASFEKGAPPDPRLMQEMIRYTQEMMQKGVVVVTGGLLPSAAGARLTAQDGILRQVDGPFAETKELVAGFAILEVASKEEALRHGREFMQKHIDVLGPGWSGTCEVRPMFAGGSDMPCAQS